MFISFINSIYLPFSIDKKESFGNPRWPPFFLNNSKTRHGIFWDFLDEVNIDHLYISPKFQLANLNVYVKP